LEVKLPMPCSKSFMSVVQNMKKWAETAKTAHTPIPAPVPVITADRLVKVGGLFRIRENYTPVWRLEDGEDGRKYIVRADAETGEKFVLADDETPTQTVHAYRVAYQGSLYLSWECPQCRTANLSKIARQYTCKMCRASYDQKTLETGEKQYYTQDEVVKHNAEYGKRMRELGIRIAHISLLRQWSKEAKSPKKVNPWAVCHSVLGPEKDEKFERCVKKIKKKQGM